MIQDHQTNYLYLADTLPKKYPDFFARLDKLLLSDNIEFSLLPHTKDVWAVDYMPIQVSDDRFVQFVYNPDYLQSEKWLKTIPDVDLICNTLDIITHKSDIKLDGGNVIKGKDCIILCDKIFKENAQMSRKDLERNLRDELQVEKIVFIPTDPFDTIGHADGMVRFVDDSTVIINNYSDQDKTLSNNLKEALNRAKLDFIEIAYNPYGNKKDIRANGIYINYLQMENKIILPMFNMREDDIVLKQFEGIFKGQFISTIESNEIAEQGGVLNCISWNIKSDKK